MALNRSSLSLRDMSKYSCEQITKDGKRLVVCKTPSAIISIPKRFANRAFKITFLSELGLLKL